jgi:hypothetical protein
MAAGSKSDRPGSGRAAEAAAAPAAAPRFDRRSYATLSIDRLLTSAIAPAARKRGFVQAALLAEWRTVVGPSLAGRCQPVRIDLPRGQWRQGTLYLAARGGAALELQHVSRQIIERVNGYFGFPAVRQIKLLQLVLPGAPMPRPEPPPRPLDGAEEAAIQKSVADLDDDPLKQALASLGRSVRRGQG